MALISCGLGNNAGFQKDVPPGIVNLSGGFWDEMGTSKFSFTASAGQVYYIRFSVDQAEAWTASAGLVAEAIEQMVTQTCRPVRYCFNGQSRDG